MFNNRKDPLIDSVKKVMAENETRRQAEFDLNEELGIASKRALPHEHHANYDALLEQKIAEALHPNQQKLDVHEPEKDKLTAQDFKMLRAKKKPKVNEVIMAPGDTDDTADQIAKKLDQLRSNAMPTGTPEDGSKTISDIIGRMKINNAMKTFNSGLKNVKESLNENLKSHFKSWTNSEDAPRDDQSGDDNAVHRKAMSYLSGTKVPKENHDGMAEKLTKMFHGMKESINENHVLYTHPKADIKVVRKGKGSKEGAAIEVHKGGKKVASGDYDHGADAFFVNVGGKGQKSFDSAKDIANHFHGMSEQFQQIDEVSIEKLKAYVAKRAPQRYSTPKGEKAQSKHARSQGMVDKANARIDKDDEKKTGKKVLRSNSPLYDYDEETHISGDNISEKAPSGAKYERMIKHIKDKYSKDGKLGDKEKSIAYATAWKAKNKNMKEGLTAEQVMAEIRKNLGEAKMKKIEEGPLDKTENDDPIIASSDARSDKWNKELENKNKKSEYDATTAGNPTDTPAASKPTTPNVIKNQDTGAPGQDPGDRGSSLSKPATPTTGSGMKTQGSGAPGQDPGDRGSSAPSKLPTFASGAPGTTSRITPTPNVDKNVPTGGAPAAGAAALTKQTPKPAPSAAKPTAPAAAKDDIWDDSKIQRTGEHGMETAADFNRNQDLYKQRMAAGGQRPAPSSAPSSPAKPTAPKPTTPTAPTGSSTMRDAAMSDRGGGGTSSTSQNGGSAMPSGAGGNAALRAAKRDGDGTTSDTFNRFQSNKPGTTSDTFNRLQSNKPGTYTRASQTPSNEVDSPANDTVGTSTNQNRTPAKDMLARPTKPPTSALNTRNNTSVAESFTDTIMKVLKG